MTTTSIVGYPFNSSSSTLDPISTNTTPIITNTTPIITNPIITNPTPISTNTTPISTNPIITNPTPIITKPISIITNVEYVMTDFDDGAKSMGIITGYAVYIFILGAILISLFSIHNIDYILFIIMSILTLSIGILGVSMYKYLTKDDKTQKTKNNGTFLLILGIISLIIFCIIIFKWITVKPL